MGFDQAIKMLRQNHELTRTKWDDPTQVIQLRDKMLWRYDATKRASFPFRPTVEDVLAEDWELVR
jgi:hypothetical protein